jgi:putative endonuclease
LGSIAEDRAVEFLEDMGFEILDRNFYSRFGEIDIVALRDKTLRFIEVKSGKGEPIFNITPTKLSKIKKTSEFYINQNRLSYDYCFDALIVKEDSIELVENISFF